MNRRFVMLSVALLLALPLLAPSASACDHGTTCQVDRTCEKIANGVRCTVKATGGTTVDQVRECVRSCSGKAEEVEGVDVRIEEIEGGIVVTTTSDDTAAVKALHAKADGCTKGDRDCCAKAKSKCCPGHGEKGCAHSKADAPKA